MVLEAFLLGISSGTYCVFNCAPVAVPLFLSEDLDRKSNWNRLTLFLGGRLIGYLFFGFLLGLLGAYTLGYFDPFIQQKLESITVMFLGIVLIVTGLPREKESRISCLVHLFRNEGRFAPIIIGILTGISFCPPFFVAAARVFGLEGSFSGLIYFFFFFLGTSIFMLPFGGFFLFSRFKKAVKAIGGYLRIMIGVYFIVFLGIFALIMNRGC